MELKKKEQKQKIERNFDGFINSKLKDLKQKPTLRELTLLRVIIQITNSYELKFFETRNKKYFWIARAVIFKKLENIHYTEDMLKRDLAALDRMDLIDRYMDKKSGKTRVFYNITKTTKDLFIFNTK